MNASMLKPTNLSTRWNAIGKALGLRISAPATIALPTGYTLEVDALVHDFGGSRGMLLVTDNAAVWPIRSTIVEAGYGFSVLSDPGLASDTIQDMDTVVELLSDWGWTGLPSDEPAWLARLHNCDDKH